MDVRDLEFFHEFIIGPLQRIEGRVADVAEKLDAADRRIDTHLADHKAAVQAEVERKQRVRNTVKAVAATVGGPLILALIAKILGAPIG